MKQAGRIFGEVKFVECAMTVLGWMVGISEDKIFF
jgi:hypothetical protein